MDVDAGAVGVVQGNDDARDESDVVERYQSDWPAPLQP